MHSAIRWPVMPALATLLVGAACLDSVSAIGAPTEALEPPKKAIAPPKPVATPAPVPVAMPAPVPVAKAPPAATAPAATAKAAPAATTAPPAATGSAAAAAPKGSGTPATPAGLSTFSAGSLSKLDDRLDALRKRIEERQKTLDARRQAERDRIRIRWGSVADLPAVRTELQTYAVRVARLERIQELAQVEAKPAVTARASKALDKENVRHERTMVALASGANAPAAGGAK